MLKKTVESPLDYKRSNQSILKEINPEYSLEGLTLKLKLQYFGHLMQRTDSLGMIEGGRRRRRQRTRRLSGITGSMDMSLRNSLRWWRTGKPGVLESMWLQRAEHTWATEQNCNHFVLNPPAFMCPLREPGTCPFGLTWICSFNYSAVIFQKIVMTNLGQWVYLLGTQDSHKTLSKDKE